MAAETVTYWYDVLGRLGAVRKHEQGPEQAIAYDAAGNRINYSSNVSGPATASLAVGNASTTEGGAPSFTVTRSGNLAGAVSASCTTSGGAAASGADFTATSGTVSFAANQVDAIISVPTIDVSLLESTETMTVTLSSRPQVSRLRLLQERVASSKMTRPGPQPWRLERF